MRPLEPVTNQCFTAFLIYKCSLFVKRLVQHLSYLQEAGLEKDACHSMSFGLSGGFTS
jgi:hypothetical protein